MNLKNKSYLNKIFKKIETYLLLFIILFSITLTVLNPTFISLENVLDLLKSSSLMFVLAAGTLMVIISGGIDVSFTTIAIFSVYVAGRIMIAYDIDNILIAFLISCTVGILLGAINAIFIALFKIPTLIVTLATASLFQGILYSFIGTKGIYASELPDSFSNFGLMNIFRFTINGNEYKVSVFILIFIGIGILTWLILKFTMLGKGIYSIGGNREAARRIGLNIVGIQFFIYCFMGFLSGIMGVMQTSVINLLKPQNIIGKELMVIAAVVIGGAKITGGYGTVFGALLGVILINILRNNLILIGLSSIWMQLFIGVVIIFGVTITSYQENIRKKLT